ncbi:hypothetical protein [Agrobacterium vitis]|uniref:Uncharacterized protein n=1 Tax=Agrobacterium vitis TaxID=373 RepID=A0AAE2RCP9_AGRVI|nr:hypothetical protein [Agrobacterium vitis]MBF2714037.1 hypothetical protein [Agrobacterium vitis]MVA37533.1 hypothetical protein [Agrobacterium vitis]
MLHIIFIKIANGPTSLFTLVLENRAIETKWESDAVAALVWLNRPEVAIACHRGPETGHLRRGSVARVGVISQPFPKKTNPLSLLQLSTTLKPL